VDAFTYGVIGAVAWADRNDWEMWLASNGDLAIDGTLTQNAGDYAEYMESLDGKKIPNGTSVINEGNKIRPCLPGESPIGVITATPTILGNSDVDCGRSWKHKYLVDEFGQREVEDAEYWTKKIVEIKNDGSKVKKKIFGYSDIEPAPKGATTAIVKREKINPLWDKNKEYKTRKEVIEWYISINENGTPHTPQEIQKAKDLIK